MKHFSFDPEQTLRAIGEICSFFTAVYAALKSHKNSRKLHALGKQCLYPECGHICERRRAQKEI